MPIPASISARRHDSNHLPPSYQDHDPAIKHHDEAPTNPSTQNVPSEPTVQSSLLQPRVAVALGLSAKWHPLLFVCRLLSILPALWWGVPVALRILAQAVVLAGNSSAVWAYAQKTQSIAWLRDYGRLTPDLGSGADSSLDFETRLRMTEMVLGIVWVRLPFPLSPSPFPSPTAQLTTPAMVISAPPQPTSPSPSPTVSCPAGSSSTRRRQRSCACSP